MKPCKDETGIRISKNMIGLVTLMIILLTTVSTAVAYTVGVKTTVEALQSDMGIMKQNMNEITPRMYHTEREIAVIQSQYQEINRNIEEIKTMLRREGYR